MAKKNRTGSEKKKKREEAAAAAAAKAGPPGSAIAGSSAAASAAVARSNSGSTNESKAASNAGPTGSAIEETIASAAGSKSGSAAGSNIATRKGPQQQGRKDTAVPGASTKKAPAAVTAAMKSDDNYSSVSSVSVDAGLSSPQEDLGIKYQNLLEEFNTYRDSMEKKFIEIDQQRHNSTLLLIRTDQLFESLESRLTRLENEWTVHSFESRISELENESIVRTCIDKRLHQLDKKVPQFESVESRISELENESVARDSAHKQLRQAIELQKSETEKAMQATESFEDQLDVLCQQQHDLINLKPLQQEESNERKVTAIQSRYDSALDELWNTVRPELDAIYDRYDSSLDEVWHFIRPELDSIISLVDRMEDRVASASIAMTDLKNPINARIDEIRNTIDQDFGILHAQFAAYYQRQGG